MNPNVVIANTGGLSTHGNDLSAEPGSTAVADNVTFSRERLPELRRGFKDFSDNLPDFSPEQLIVGSNGVDRYLHLDSGLWYYDGSTWIRKVGNNGQLADQYGGLWVTGTTVYLTCVEKNVVISINLLTGAKQLIAGTAGASGTADGAIGVGKFNAPISLWGDGSGNLYVVDRDNHAIRKVVIATGVISTLAGTIGSSGSANGGVGTGKFNTPFDIWGDVSGNLYIADNGNGAVRKVVISTGVISNLSTLLGSCAGIWGDGAGSLYLSITTTIRTVGVGGGLPTTISTPGGTGKCVRGDGLGNLYQCNNALSGVQKIVLSGGAATFVAGTSGSSGFANGLVGTAKFDTPNGIGIDGDGNLLVGDFNNRALRKVYLVNGLTTTVDGGFAATSAASQINKFADGMFVGPD